MNISTINTKGQGIHMNNNSDLKLAHDGTTFSELPKCPTLAHLAKLFGVSKQTIGGYEKQGWIPKARISNGRVKIWFIEDIINHFNQTESET